MISIRMVSLNVGFLTGFSTLKKHKSSFRKVVFWHIFSKMALFFVQNGTFLMKIIDFGIRASPSFDDTLHGRVIRALF